MFDHAEHYTINADELIFADIAVVLSLSCSAGTWVPVSETHVVFDRLMFLST